MRTFLISLRHSFRRLRRELLPGVSAMLTLGLGLGVTAALVTLTRSVLLSAPPVRSVEELVLLRPEVTPTGGAPDENETWSYPMFEVLRRSLEEGRSGAAASVAAFTPWPRSVNFASEGAGGGGARPVRIEMVSASYLDVLGVRPAVGRAFVPADDGPNGAAVVLLSHDLWQAEFAGDPRVVGRRVSIERQSFEVVGVLPERFAGLSETAEAWVPMASAPALTFPRRLTGALSFWHGVVAREGAALEVALDRAALAIAEAIPVHEALGAGKLSLRARSYLEVRRDPSLRNTLSLLLLLAAAVLTIAAINVAHLVLTRVTAQASEVSVRQALGADVREAWWRHLADATWIGGGALVSCLVFGPVLLGLIERYRPARIEEALGVLRLDVGTAMIALGITLLVILGLALLGTVGERVFVRRSRGLSAAGAAQEAGGAGLRSVFVVIQLSMVLVTALAALAATRGLVRLYDRPLGFDPTSALTLRVSLPRTGADEAATLAFFTGVAERLAALPGVESAAAAYCLPLSDACDQVRVRLEGAAEEASESVVLNMIDPAYPRALGVALRAGRVFSDADHEAAPPVVLVDRTAALRLWPGSPLEAALGRRLSIGVGWPESGFAEVVGVVDDVPASNLLQEARPGIYVPLAQLRYREASFVVRHAERADGLAAAASRVVRELDPEVAVYAVAPLSESVRRAGSSRRFGAVLLTVLGVVASSLAGLGVYAVTNYAVTRRRREFAVRAAFGARSRQLEGQVLASGLRWVILGLGIGGGLALALARLLVVRLEGALVAEPGVILVAAVWVAALALLAAWLPARRAGRVDPARALREE